MSSMGLQFKMEHKIIDKLKKVGATSIENAVTCEEAHLNPQEKYWLGYFAGIFLGKIKKTKSHKYYVS